MNTRFCSTAMAAFLLALTTASFAGDSGDNKKTDGAKPETKSSVEKLVAAEKPAAAAASTDASQKKLVMPNASDYVKEGIACGTAN
jgi:hypothetical protein